MKRRVRQCDSPKFEVHEAHNPIAALGLRDPDGFMTDRRADEDEVAAPLDFPIVADPPDLVRGVVPGILEARRIRPRRRHMHATRRLLSQRFVGPFRVEFPAQAVKPRLLLSQRRGGRRRRLVLQRPVKPLVTPVLFRVPGSIRSS